MRRVLPLALLSSACAGQPWTPSVPVAFWSEPVPDGREMLGDIHDIDLLGRWSLPATDPWAPYQKVTLLTALADMEPGTRLPDTNALEVVQRARVCAHRVATAGIPRGTMFVVDLRGAASVAFGAELSRASASPVSLVLTFNNWPAQDEVVPAEEALAALVADAPRAAGPGSPVFLLDAWRLAYRFDQADPDSVDNRYAVTDLPSAEVLALAGINRVVYLVEDLDETDVEEDDLNGVFGAWQASGVRIAMMDLDLSIALRDWDDATSSALLDVRPRHVILDDPGFYVRARGGFGGIRGTPGRAGGHAHWGGSGFHGGGHGGG